MRYRRNQQEELRAWTRLAWWPADPKGRWPRGREVPSAWWLAALREARLLGPRWQHPAKYIEVIRRASRAYIASLEQAAAAASADAPAPTGSPADKPMQREERLRDENLSADRTHYGYLI